MKFVIVAQHHSRSPQAVPLAGAFLAAALLTDDALAACSDVILLDTFPDQSIEETATRILGNAPDAVGISVYLWNRDRARNLAHHLRSLRPGMVIFAGGPEPTTAPLPFLHGSLFDFVVVGEGEATFVAIAAALCEGRPAAGIPGIAVLNGNVVALTPRKPVALLDTIPSPLLSGVLDCSRYGGMLWQLSRGCDFGCAYCCDTAGVKGTRRFSLDRVEAELRLLARSRLSQVTVLDSTFNRDADRAKRVLRLIRKHAPHIHFHFEVRCEFLDREQAHLFGSITCSLQIGLQSARKAVLAGVGRSIDREDFAAKTALLNDSGAVFGFDLIYGLPGDTLDGFRESLDFALSLYPNHLDIFPLAVLPGTPLAAGAARLGLRHLPAPPYTLIESPTCSAADLFAAELLAGACDLFYSRGKAVAWFNGLCRALSLAPSALLEEFSAWLSREAPGTREETLDDDGIRHLQRRFLQVLFTARRLTRLLPLALDLVDFHHYHAAALQAPPPELPTERDLARLDLAAACFTVAPSARLARFAYEIADILEAGEIDLAEFVRCFRRSGSCAVIYPRAGEVLTESLIEPYFMLLEQMDGRTATREALNNLGLDPEEALSFMEFAVAEGIVVGEGTPGHALRSSPADNIAV